MQQPVEALRWWLAAALAAYNGRFKLALNRGYNGLGREAEGAWAGEYDFVQLADPQLGMLHMDKSWAEELTMLKLAIDHVNRLRPRFLLISGDLTNAWPCKENARVIAAQRASFQVALRTVDPHPNLFTLPLPLTLTLTRRPCASSTLRSPSCCSRATTTSDRTRA